MSVMGAEMEERKERRTDMREACAKSSSPTPSDML